jgi:type VI secretion system protein ImpM
MVAGVPPGWHGKLPSLGDFASRRLDPAFIEAWDGWLSGGLHALREADPHEWLDAYLASPSWRFLLAPAALPGEAGRQGWAGVLMPSVDRVGRYFPLTIVQPLGDGPASTGQMQMLWHWLGRLDELAGEALQDDWNVERLEDELARMSRPSLEPQTPTLVLPPEAHGALVEQQLPGGADAATAIGIATQALWRRQTAGTAWWYSSTELLPPRLLTSRGLPGTLRALFGDTGVPASTTRPISAFHPTQA